MPFGTQERRELRNLLRQFRAAHTWSVLPSGTGKALEAWVMMRMAGAASAHGWTVRLHGGDGNPLPSGADFLFRTQPGPIKKASIAAVGYVALTVPTITPTSSPTGAPASASDTFELHGGVQWRGRSGARHECDISLLPADVGIAIRGTAGGGYPRGLPIVAIECKDKTSDAPPDEMRQTLARLFDLACIQQSWDGAPHRIFDEAGVAGWGGRVPQYRPFFAAGQFAIVRASGFGLGASQLGHHYNIARHSDVYQRPTSFSMGDLLGRFTQILDALA